MEYLPSEGLNEATRGDIKMRPNASGTHLTK